MSYGRGYCRGRTKVRTTHRTPQFDAIQAAWLATIEAQQAQPHPAAKDKAAERRGA